MNLFDIYKEYKKSFSDHLIFIKAGEFIEVLEDDAYIMHYIFNYKILEKKKYLQVGFPKNRLNSILNKLSNISIILVEKNLGGGGTPI